MLHCTPGIALSALIAFPGLARLTRAIPVCPGECHSTRAPPDPARYKGAIKNHHVLPLFCFLPPWVALQCSFGLATRRFTNGSSLHAASTAAPASGSHAFTAATAHFQTLQCRSPAAPSTRSAASATFRSLLEFKSRSRSELPAQQPDFGKQPGQHPLLQPSEPVQHARCSERIHVRRYDLALPRFTRVVHPTREGGSVVLLERDANN